MFTRWKRWRHSRHSVLAVGVCLLTVMATLDSSKSAIASPTSVPAAPAATALDRSAVEPHTLPAKQFRRYVLGQTGAPASPWRCLDPGRGGTGSRSADRHRIVIRYRVGRRRRDSRHHREWIQRGRRGELRPECVVPVLGGLSDDYHGDGSGRRGQRGRQRDHTPGLFCRIAGKPTDLHAHRAAAHHRVGPEPRSWGSPHQVHRSERLRIGY